MAHHLKFNTPTWETLKSRVMLHLRVWYSECCRNHGCAYVPRLISFLAVQGQRLLSCRYNSLNALITDTTNNVLSGSGTQYICNEFMQFTFSVCGLCFSLMQTWVLNLLFDFKCISVLSHWKISCLWFPISRILMLSPVMLQMLSLRFFWTWIFDLFALKLGNMSH